MLFSSLFVCSAVRMLCTRNSLRLAGGICCSNAHARRCCGSLRFGRKTYCGRFIPRYCTNKPPLRNRRAYFDSPLPFWHNLLLIVTSKLWGRWTLEFSGNNFAAYFYWQLHICYRFSYNKSSWISPTKQKEPLTWVEVSGKWKHSHKAAIIMKKALRFRKAFFGAPSGTRTQDPLIKSQLLYQLS